ncbi:hypothetical protein HIMB114_00008650 [alpha proteobacterium HIMB114]|nr:hypothetical protein HIMB114_00008650 [alpha proteobacterium HIMB114]
MKKKIYYPLLSTIFIFVLIEVILFFFYNIFDSKYFENFKETKKRYNFNQRKIEKENYFKIKKELKTNKIKIAIFGGSSANGYPFDIKFSDILAKTLGDEYIVHNYSKNGEPFVDFQSKKILLLQNYYDYVVIYSGHNEIWSYIYHKSKILKNNITFPNGAKVNYKSIYQQRDREINKIKKYILDKNIYEFDEILFYFSDNLRSYNIFRKIIVRLTKLKKNKKLINKNLGYNILEDKPFLNQVDKKNIINRYKKDISTITKNKKPKQKIIILPVLSNYFFPSFSDHIPNLDIWKKKKLEDQIITYYKQINLLKNFDNIEKLKNLEAKAYKNNLEAIICNENKFIKCIDKAKISNSLDTIPLRVLPEINKFITNMDYKKNIMYIDLQTKLNELKSLDEFNEIFVDFQHPSILGHIIITEFLAKAILGKDIKIKNLHIKCDQFTFNIQNKTYIFKSNFKKAFEDNINFLKANNLNQPNINYSYDYFINRSIDFQKKCNFIQ